MPLACTNDDDSSATSAAPSSTTTTTEPARPNDGVLRIGLLLPLSGEGASIGQGMADAAQRAVDEINAAGGVLGQLVEVVPADEGADASSAADGIETLVDDGVDAVVGPASSTVALATLGALLGAGVLTCSPTATSLALDDFPSSQLFFRTAPSDSLQADAIAKLAQQTGTFTAAVAYLDDDYGRPLAEATVAALDDRALTVVDEVPFASNDETLVDQATQLVDSEADLVVVIGDGEHGMRMLSAMGENEGRFDVETPDIIVNDAVREPPSAQLVQALPASIREQIEGVSPMARPQFEEEPPGPFATNAYDCVNLIALSAVQANEDDPTEMAERMAEVSARGVACRTFETCVQLLEVPRNIDYEGPGGTVQIGSDGDPEQARFDVFEFDESGTDVSTTPSLIIPSARDRVQGVVECGDVADVEATELAVQRRPLVEAHRVHDVLDHLGGEGEQGDPPLEVIQPRRAGDQLDDLAGKRASGRPVFAHHRVPSFVRCRVPVGVGLATFRHRVEAEHRLSFGRQRGIQPLAQQVLGHPLGVLADLGDAHVAVDDVQPGGLQAGLQPAQHRPVAVQRHDRQVALVAEHRRRDDLPVRGLDRLDRGSRRLPIDRPPGRAEQVEHSEADLRAHGLTLRSVLWNLPVRAAFGGRNGW